MESVLGSIGGDLAKRLGVDGKKKSNYDVIIDCDVCIKCGQCLNACLPKALEMNNDNIKYNPEKCTHCGLCAESCPVFAIKINR
jgi:Fe-S-cluster-containing hydrogenase component 2